MVQEKAASRVALAERPASAVEYQTFLVFAWVNIPELFDTDTVMLRIFASIQVESADKLFAQVATAAFSKHCVLRTQFHTRHEAVFFRAVFCYAHVTGYNAFYYVVFNDQGGGRESRIDLYAERFCLFAEPAADITK